MSDFVFNNLVQIIPLAFKQIARKTNQALGKKLLHGTLSTSKPNQRSENLFLASLTRIIFSTLTFTNILSVLLAISQKPKPTIRTKTKRGCKESHHPVEWQET